MTRQKAYLIQAGAAGAKGIDELNLALGRGWRVVATSPLGGAATGATDEAQMVVGCLVIVERDDRPSTSVVESMEEEDIVDELLEGDGANSGVDPDL